MKFYNIINYDIFFTVFLTAFFLLVKL